MNQQLQDFIDGFKNSNSPAGQYWSDWSNRFIKDYPHGSKFTSDQFDYWAAGVHLLYDAPNRNAVEWKEHVECRDYVINSIKNSGFSEYCRSPFYIVWMRGAYWEVMSIDNYASYFHIESERKIKAVLLRRQKIEKQIIKIKCLGPMTSELARLLQMRWGRFKRFVRDVLGRVHDDIEEYRIIDQQILDIAIENRENRRIVLPPLREIQDQKKTS